MKNAVFFSAFAFLFISVPFAHASDGLAEGCYGAALAVQSELIDGETSAYLPTGGQVCLRSTDVKFIDESEMRATGNFEITVFDVGGKVVARRTFTAMAQDAGAGHAYHVFGTPEEIEKWANGNGETWNLVIYDMRNDHIAVGDPAGFVKIGVDAQIALIQR